MICNVRLVDQFAFTVIVPKIAISVQIEGVFEQSITSRVFQGFLKRLLKKSPGPVLPVEHANACTVHWYINNRISSLGGNKNFQTFLNENTGRLDEKNQGFFLQSEYLPVTTLYTPINTRYVVMGLTGRAAALTRRLRLDTISSCFRDPPEHNSRPFSLRLSQLLYTSRFIANFPFAHISKHRSLPRTLWDNSAVFWRLLHGYGNATNLTWKESEYSGYISGLRTIFLVMLQNSLNIAQNPIFPTPPVIRRLYPFIWIQETYAVTISRNPWTSPHCPI